MCRVLLGGRGQWPVISLWGVTTLYSLGVEPPERFLVKTSWEAEQTIEAGDTMMDVEWQLDFGEYDWGGQLSCRGDGYSKAQSHFWKYDKASHAGTLTLNHRPYAFTYGPSTDHLTHEYSSTLRIDGTSVPVGGSLQFVRKEEEPSRPRR